jgi:T5SS/PEP-CTERM-associated repeat protein
MLRMRQRTSFLRGFLVCIALTAQWSYAQYTADFQTNVISGVASNWPGSYYIGNTNSADALLIESSGVLADGGAYFGYSSNSCNNSVLVTGPGSVWSNGFGTLYIGNSGAGNSLAISQGGKVVNSEDSYLGYNASSSNNTVVVTDTGSVWSNQGFFYLGQSGASNSLVISNGGQVLDSECWMGAGSSSNNSVLVTDPGSVWNNSGNSYSLSINRSGNSLVISNGGRVSSTTATVYGSRSIDSSNNVWIIGTGSVWSNLGWLSFGGGGNRLVIADGGKLVSNGGTVGSNSCDSNNVLVTGSGSVWSNSGDFCLGFVYSYGNRLVISNGGQVFNNTGTVVSGAGGLLCPNSVLVSDPGSVWSNAAALYIWDSLAISNGAKVAADNGYVGASVHVTGSGSVWNSATNLSVGNDGSQSSLVIDHGAWVTDRAGYVGTNHSLASALVTDSGSVWSNTGTLTIGYWSAYDSLTISNGGQVVNSTSYVGYNSNSNSVLVADAAVWQNGVLHVGESGVSNLVDVAGGTVFATNLVVGAASPTCGNWLQLDSGSVYVTNGTGDAVLEVRNGTLILNGGTLQVDILVMTNDCGLFVPQGGSLHYSQLVLDPNLSALGDGIPNGWKQQYGFNPLDPTVANADTDGDGFNNLQKYLAGFNPINPAAYLHIINIAASGTNVIVTYLGASGDTNYVPGVQVRTNVLDYTTGDAAGNFTNGSWQDTGQTNILGVGISAAGGEGTGLGTVTNMTDVGGAATGPSRYYRVRVVP